MLTRAKRVIKRWMGHPAAPAPEFNDPTLSPPPAYTRERADQVFGEAFRRCFEYMTGARVPGHVMEFGTFRGFTARQFATLLREFELPGDLYLFDSFEGLPEIDSEVDKDSWEVAGNQVWFQGQMALERDIAPRIQRAISSILGAERVKVVKGYFEDTIEANLPTEPVALVHVDCDLYSSTRTVLDALFAHGLFQDGTVLLCDDYNCNRANPQMGERRALADAFGQQERFTYSPWFSYGWHGQAFFVHDTTPVLQGLGNLSQLVNQ